MHDFHGFRLHASKEMTSYSKKKRREPFVFCFAKLKRSHFHTIKVSLCALESSWQCMRLVYFPQLLSAFVWCWETVVQSLWMSWEGEKRERSHTGVSHRWGFGDCQIQCLALSFIVLCENKRLPGHQCVMNLFAIHAATKRSTL